MSKLSWKHLSELTLNITDGTHSTVKDDLEGMCYLLSSKNIKNGVVNIGDNERKINSITLNKLKERTKLEEDDILLTTVGTIGEVAIKKDNRNDYDFQRSVAIIKPNKEIIDVRYLYYALKTEVLKEQYEKFSTGSVQKCLFIGNINKLEIPYFTLYTQKKIADLLSSLDDKIEINNKINQELEELGQSLYTKWFINFDFPNEEGKPYKSSGGEMIESELGMIPKGWKVGSISDISEFVNGYAFKSSTYIDNGKYRIITIKNVGNRALELKNNDSFVDIIPNNINQEQVLQLGDLLISLTGYTGRTCLNCESNSLLNQRVAKIKCTDNLEAFVYNLFSNQLIKDEIEKISHGSSQKNVSTKDISNINIIIPEDFNIFKQFNEVANFKSQILSNILENKKLEELRDFLIPQLISGNLEIKDMENKYEEKECI